MVTVLASLAFLSFLAPAGNVAALPDSPSAVVEVEPLADGVAEGLPDASPISLSSPLRQPAQRPAIAGAVAMPEAIASADDVELLVAEMAALLNAVAAADADEQLPPLIRPALVDRRSMEGVTPIGEILEKPEDCAGQVRLLAGEYRGEEPSDLSPLAKAQRADVMAWVLRDATGEIYCAERLDVPMDVGLSPEYSAGKRIKLLGTVELSPKGVPYVVPLGIYRWRGERGASCGVEIVKDIEKPEELSKDPTVMGFRLIFTNDTTEPISLMYTGGYDHDLIISRDGREVWRLSRVKSPTLSFGEVDVPPQGLTFMPRATFQPGGRHEETVSAWPVVQNPSRVYVDYWRMVDQDGRPVPPGMYEAQGVIGPRIFTFPIRFEVGSP